jgi:hypothetical protein
VSPFRKTRDGLADAHGYLAWAVLGFFFTKLIRLQAKRKGWFLLSGLFAELRVYLGDFSLGFTIVMGLFLTLWLLRD